MKLFTKYFIKELLGPFLVGLGFFTFIFLLFPIIRLVDMLIVKHAPFKEIFLIFIYYLPSTIAITLPMAVLVAVLMAYGRLSSDSEIIAMRASGINYIRIFYPAILLSIIVSLTGVIFNETLLPKGNYAARKLYSEIAQRNPLTQLKAHTITELNVGNFMRSIGIDKIDDKAEIMYGIIIHEKDKSTGEERTITAKSGRWAKPIEIKDPSGKLILMIRLMLENGNIQQSVKNSAEQFINIIYTTLIVNFPQEINYSIDMNKGPREQTTSEIMSEIKRQQKSSGKKPHRLWVEYYKRFSIPFAALAFVIIALPFSLVSGRSGKSISLGISIIIIFVYYLLYTFGETAGKNGRMNELLALWISNVFFIIAGSFYIYKLSKT